MAFIIRMENGVGTNKFIVWFYTLYNDYLILSLSNKKDIVINITKLVIKTKFTNYWILYLYFIFLNTNITNKNRNFMIIYN